MRQLMTATAAALLVGVAALSMPALADGLCTNDIAALARRLGNMPGLGAPVSNRAQDWRWA